MNESEARERVLNTAEQLFSERGYAAVTLRDIADALGIKQASLYYHAPGGKQALFAEVTERGLHRHRHGLEHAIAEAAADADTNVAERMKAQLNAAAHWLLSQPPLNLSRMAASDMPQLDHEVAAHLEHTAYQALMQPLAHIFVEAAQTGELRTEVLSVEPSMLAGTLLASIASIHQLPNEFFRNKDRVQHIAQLIDVLIYGLVKQQSGQGKRSS
jgi:AcrR family transcriptional regulator